MGVHGIKASPAIGVIGDGAYTTETSRIFSLKHESIIGFDFSVEDENGNRVFSVLRTHFHRLTLLDAKTQVVGSLDISFPRPWDRAVLSPEEARLFTIRAKKNVPSFTTEMDVFMEGDETEPSVVVQFQDGTQEDMHVICNRTKQKIAGIHYSTGKLPQSDTLTISVPVGGDYALATFIALAVHAIYHF